MSIELRKVYKSYGELRVIEDFSLELSKEKIYAFLGPSGSGKTTLINLLVKNKTPDSGQIIGSDNMKTSYIFQEERLLPWLNVKENIEIVLDRIDDKELSHKITNNILNTIGLNGFENYYPKELSGGMRQRVSIGRAFAYDGDILAMDEPFKGLDKNLKKSLINSIYTHWQKKKPYIFFITHDIDEALLIADEIIFLDGPPIKIIDRIKIDINQKTRLENKEIFKSLKLKVDK